MCGECSVTCSQLQVAESYFDFLHLGHSVYQCLKNPIVSHVLLVKAGYVSDEYITG